jgi:hypothetical protein
MSPDRTRNQDCADEGQQKFTRPISSSQNFLVIANYHSTNDPYFYLSSGAGTKSSFEAQSKVSASPHPKN